MFAPPRMFQGLKREINDKARLDETCLCIPLD